LILASEGSSTLDPYKNRFFRRGAGNCALARSTIGTYIARTNDFAVALTMNINLPEHNGSDTWELPFAATYVIDTDFTVQLAFVDADYTRRLEPNEIIKSLQALHA
jgi:hypothetical protein